MLGTSSGSVVVIRFFDKKTGEFGLLNGISNHVELVQLIDTDGNVNHAVSINVCWI